MLHRQVTTTGVPLGSVQQLELERRCMDLLLQLALLRVVLLRASRHLCDVQLHVGNHAVVSAAVALQRAHMVLGAIGVQMVLHLGQRRVAQAWPPHRRRAAGGFLAQPWAWVARSLTLGSSASHALLSRNSLK